MTHLNNMESFSSLPCSWKKKVWAPPYHFFPLQNQCGDFNPLKWIETGFMGQRLVYLGVLLIMVAGWLGGMVSPCQLGKSVDRVVQVFYILDFLPTCPLKYGSVKTSNSRSVYFSFLDCQVCLMYFEDVLLGTYISGSYILLTGVDLFLINTS